MGQQNPGLMTPMSQMPPQQTYNYGGGNQFQMQQPQQQQFPGQMNFQGQHQPPMGVPQAPTPPQKTPTPEPPKPKAPIPEEHIYLQTVLNELRTQCVNAAANPVSFSFCFSRFFSIKMCQFVPSASQKEAGGCSSSP